MDQAPFTSVARGYRGGRYCTGQVPSCTVFVCSPMAASFPSRRPLVTRKSEARHNTASNDKCITQLRSPSEHPIALADATGGIPTRAQASQKSAPSSSLKRRSYKFCTCLRLLGDRCMPLATLRGRPRAQKGTEVS
jgi:hypothetical protein